MSHSVWTLSWRRAVWINEHQSMSMTTETSMWTFPCPELQRVALWESPTWIPVRGDVIYMSLMALLVTFWLVMALTWGQKLISSLTQYWLLQQSIEGICLHVCLLLCAGSCFLLIRISFVIVLFLLRNKFAFEFLLIFAQLVFPEAEEEIGEHGRCSKS